VVKTRKRQPQHHSRL